MGSKSMIAWVSFLLFMFSMVRSETLSLAPETPPSPPSPPRECPELGLCVDVLRLGERGSPENGCCTLVGDLLQANATLCVCDIARTQLIGIPVDLDIKIKLILDVCKHNQTFICN
ncbi:36.4 kDa proline-rich protein-like [Vigna unguiculata]|uniref:Hydrophobic seed protein n=1 Tax=Vigna unguiculata TaxID=3917 RepID=A0A4D6KQ92_VIGUN|nr:36.4 kDa proline-rich protein-like [Vigna unguiculata]QCD77259.1 Hydrophobic seed protein [Vigna unguiculata]